MNCRICKFWTGNRTDAHAERGQCRRFPPQAGGLVPVQTLQGTAAGITWGTPEPGPDHWCGEFTLELLS